MQRSSLLGRVALFTWPANILFRILVKVERSCCNENLFYFTGLHFELKKIYPFKLKLAK